MRSAQALSSWIHAPGPDLARGLAPRSDPRGHLDRRPGNCVCSTAAPTGPRRAALLRLAGALRRRRRPRTAAAARTLDSWRTELLAYFDTNRISNGPTEAINLLIKKIKRVGHGFRNFDNYRLRLLLYCGTDWDTPRATPIRGRLPRFIA